MVARDRNAAIYRQIAATLRARIQTAELTPGQALGSEATLAYEFGVSHSTVGEALRVLAREGLVTMAFGQVARVRERPPVETVKVPRGATLIVRVPTPEEADELDIPEGQSIVVMTIGGRDSVYSAERVRFTFA